MFEKRPTGRPLRSKRQLRDRGVFVVQAVDKPGEQDVVDQAVELANETTKRHGRGNGWLIAAVLIAGLGIVASILFTWWSLFGLVLMALCGILHRRALILNAKEDAENDETIKEAGLTPVPKVVLLNAEAASDTTADTAAATDEANDQPAPVRYQPAPNFPVPTKDGGGWRYIWWKLYCGEKLARTGNPKYLMHPSIRNRIRQLDTAIMADSKTILYMFVVVLNQKGGSCKTTAAVMFAVFYTWITQKLTLLMDTNQAMGTTADKVMATDAMSTNAAIDAYFANLTMSPTHRQIVYGHHPEPGYGSLSVLRSVTDPERADMLANKQLSEDAPIHTRLEHGKFNQEEARQHSLTVADNGNSLNQPVVMGATDLSTAGIFTCKGDDWETIKLCRDSIQSYRRTMPKFVAQRCLVMVSGVKNFRDTVMRDAYALLFEIDPEDVLLAEFDVALSVHRNKRLTPQALEKRRLPFTAQRQSHRNQCAWRELVHRVQMFHLDPDRDDYTPPGPTASAPVAQRHRVINEPQSSDVNNTSTADPAAGAINGAPQRALTTTGG